MDLFREILLSNKLPKPSPRVNIENNDEVSIGYLSFKLIELAFEQNSVEDNSTNSS